MHRLTNLEAIAQHTSSAKAKPSKTSQRTKQPKYTPKEENEGFKQR